MREWYQMNAARAISYTGVPDAALQTAWDSITDSERVRLRDLIASSEYATWVASDLIRHPEHWPRDA